MVFNNERKSWKEVASAATEEATVWRVGGLPIRGASRLSIAKLVAYRLTLLFFFFLFFCVPLFSQPIVCKGLKLLSP